MDSEMCSAETSSLFIVAHPDVEAAEIAHPCAHNDGHDGPHHCMFCGVEWNAEVTC